MNDTVELLQTLIRNRCVNDGSPESGEEVRNADVLQNYIEGPGVTVERFEPTPGRVSIVGRIEGTDPDAPSLCLMGHTDVVPVNRAGWVEDPFGGEVLDTGKGPEVWGRGAVDMLNLTASMAVTFRDLARSGFRPTGDLIYFAVADEEAGSAHGARWMADHHPDAIRATYALTESGGLHSTSGGTTYVGMNVAEKGVAWRRLTVHGTPGHGSAPFRGDNALVKAAGIVQRLAEYRPAPRFHELWPNRVASLDIPDEFKDMLLDPAQIDDVLDNLPSVGAASHFHACTHTTFSPNLVDGNPSGNSRMKVNVIPDTVVVEVDIRTLPGEGPDEVDAHLRAALGRPRRPRRGRGDHERRRVDQPDRHAAVGLDAARRQRTVPDGDAQPAVHRRLHRRPRLPRPRRHRLRRRVVQPVARRHRVRLTLPRPQRTDRRRVAVAHHPVLPRRRHRRIELTRPHVDSRRSD